VYRQRLRNSGGWRPRLPATASPASTRSRTHSRWRGIAAGSFAAKEAARAGSGGSSSTRRRVQPRGSPHRKREGWHPGAGWRVVGVTPARANAARGPHPGTRRSKLEPALRSLSSCRHPNKVGGGTPSVRSRRITITPPTRSLLSVAGTYTSRCSVTHQQPCSVRQRRPSRGDAGAGRDRTSDLGIKSPARQHAAGCSELKALQIAQITVAANSGERRRIETSVYAHFTRDRWRSGQHRVSSDGLGGAGAR
jgi:hypothetical protein